MQPLRILVVEDQTITALDIKETLEDVGHIVVDTPRNYESAIASVKKYLPDLAIIDIKLTNSAADGIITAEKIRSIHPIPFIFLTANSEKATFDRAKETLPSAYLLKPFDPDELRMQVEIVWLNHKNNQPNYAPTGLFFSVINKGYQKINPHEVVVIEADGAYVNVFLVEQQKPFEISMNLNKISSHFASPNFFRLSRSYLINLDYVERIVENTLFLQGFHQSIPIPNTSKAELVQKLTIVKTNQN